MTTNDSRLRKRIKKPSGKLFLFAFEGQNNNKTETLYFNHFKSSNTVIKTCAGAKTDPIKMVNSLVKTKTGEEYKTYCVCDTDTDPSRNKVIKQALVAAKKNNIELITSSPCFEEWILCHFESNASTRELTSEEALNKVKHHIKNYDKNVDIYDDIKEYTIHAINIAKEKEKYQLSQKHDLYTVEANPSTMIYKIIEELLKINKESM